MRKVYFATHCMDNESGEIGCFTFEKEQADKDGYFTAKNPVFPDLCELFTWCKNQDIILNHTPYNFP